MKIIDLLNKIANGEIPKKIKINNCEWKHDGIDYKRESDGEYLFDVFLRTLPQDLNIEVEILEEQKKIPEKLNVEKDEEGRIDGIYMSIQEIDERNKINSIIDYLKSKGE